MATEVTAVVGACGPERQTYARNLARHRAAILLEAEQIAKDSNAVERALRLVQRVEGQQSVVLEYPLQTPVMNAIGQVIAGDEPAVLKDLICVVDAPHLLTDLVSADHFQLGSHSANETVHVVATRAELTVNQIEYASVVVLVNTEGMDDEKLHLVRSLVSHLAPKAQLECPEDSPTPTTNGWLGNFTTAQTHAGWLCLLNNTFTPKFPDHRITAFRYEQMRPLHPGRLQEVMTRYTTTWESGRLLRSAGFAHLATRAHITALWNQVGQQLMLTPAGFDHQLEVDDEPLAFGQDLALFGLDINPDQLALDLDQAALTDHELAAGAALWADFPDPFPEWTTADR